MAEPASFTLSAATKKFDSPSELLPHLSPLEDPSKITSVHLGGNTFSPACAVTIADHLSKCSNLKFANLDDIFTSRLLSEIPPALDSLLTALLNLEKLSDVNLSDNAFGLNTVEPLVKFLEKAVPLQHLVLNNNGLGPNAGTMIANALTALAEKKRTAVSSSSNPQSSSTSSSSHDVPQLETLVCGRNRLEAGSMPAFAACFGANSALKTVKMVQNGIRQDGIVKLLSEGLSHCEGLEVLDLQDNTFTVKGATALANTLPKWPDLKELGIGDCLVGARGMVLVANALAKGSNRKLQVLRAQYNEIDAKGVDALYQAVKQDALPMLRRVELNGNKFSEDDASVEGLRLLLEERKEKAGAAEINGGEWGMDELSDLEEDSDEEEDQEQEDGKEEDDGGDDKEKVDSDDIAERILRDAEEEEGKNVAQEQDASVDELAVKLGKTGI